MSFILNQKLGKGFDCESESIEVVKFRIHLCLHRFESGFES